VTAVVCQVGLPRSARELSTLPRIDYCDAFLFAVGSTHDESAEDLIREVLEALRWLSGPNSCQAGLRSG